MLESLAHRGPDGAGKWTEGPVGLGHLMLHTTPESIYERLPLAKGDLAITADARIDNRADLIKALGLTDRPKGKLSDSELILGAYERWGEQCPEKILGDFAFAVWDGRRRALFCARDHMGVKPFYYHHRPGHLFVFGSEIKALLRAGRVPRRLNEVRVADYLATVLDDKEITFHRDVWRLPPGHSMSVGRKQAPVRSYWSLDPSREVRLSSDREYAEAFRGVFTEAVRCRLRSAFPVCSQLSGGLDSSSITCVARDLLAEEDKVRRLHTFSIVFPEVPESDESSYIAAVLAGGSLAGHKVRGDLLGPLADVEQVLRHQDEPSHVPSAFLQRELCKVARKKGMRILLEGTDGDTTVSYGEAYLTELAHKWRWRKLAIEVNRLSSNFGVLRRDIALQYAIKPLLSEPVRWVRRALRRQNRPPWATSSVINPNFARRIGLDERYQTSSRARYIITLCSRAFQERLAAHCTLEVKEQSLG